VHVRSAMPAGEPGMVFDDGAPPRELFGHPNLFVP
jgi:hypothetical protein